MGVGALLHRVFEIAEIARKVVVVGRHIDQTVTRQIEQNHTLLARCNALLGLGNRRRNGVARFGRGDDTLSLRKEHTRAAHHRPNDPESEDHREFCRKMCERIESLSAIYPDVDWEALRPFFALGHK